MPQNEAKFNIGQLVTHLKFDYRGVIFDVDPSFAGSDEWYEFMARSRPPKNHPWYHVLVHGADHTTYVAERHLAPDPIDRPVTHPLIESLFAGLENGFYIPQGPRN